MQKKVLNVPEIMLIGFTRAALGAGLGLLIADKLKGEVRKGAGWALLIFGALSTIPLALDILVKPQPAERP